MNESTQIAGAEDSASGDPMMRLGRLMGRREAFSLIAGRSAAADVENLRRIRNEKAYRELNCTWDEFCERHLHVSRRSVDRAIGHLEEFGPAFFEIAQMAHIGPKDYRAIASHVSEEGLYIDGSVVALLPENSEQISAAVAGLLKRDGNAKRKPAVSAFDAVLQRCLTLADELAALRPELDAMHKVELAAAMAKMRGVTAALGVIVVDL